MGLWGWNMWKSCLIWWIYVLKPRVGFHGTGRIVPQIDTGCCWGSLGHRIQIGRMGWTVKGGYTGNFDHQGHGSVTIRGAGYLYTRFSFWNHWVPQTLVQQIRSDFRPEDPPEMENCSFFFLGKTPDQQIQVLLGHGRNFSIGSLKIFIRWRIMWRFSKMRDPSMESPIKMDVLGVPPFMDPPPMWWNIFPQTVWPHLGVDGRREGPVFEFFFSVDFIAQLSWR